MALHSALPLVVAIFLGGCASPTSDPTRTESLASLGADPVNEPGLSLDMCGAVTEYAAASATADGVLSLDAGAWAVASGTTVTNDALLAPGARVCIDGTLDTSGRIETLAVTAEPADPWDIYGPDSK